MKLDLSNHAKISTWTIETPPQDAQRALGRILRSEDVERVAVMPDVHVASDVCVGTVIGTRDLIFPQAVGADIGCGMLSARLPLEAAALEPSDTASRCFAALHRLVPSFRHDPETICDASELLREGLTQKRLQRSASREGHVQLGTLGRGNHFVELQSDDEGELWVTIHSGSRAMGQVITAHHLARAQSDRSGLLALDSRSDDGREYLHDLSWARDYAAANRNAMLEAVTAIFHSLFGVRSDPDSVIHCDHNHVQRETHAEASLWVHRKGALSAKDGEVGVIPGSMGTESFHTIGRGCDDALGSSSHGAGRRLSRGAAEKQISRDRLRRSMTGVHFDTRAESRLSADAPEAYRDIRSVMRAQGRLTRIVRRLKPVLVYKGR
ncbi:MAG: RtcB family protein [Planctomycetota bacterium]